MTQTFKSLASHRTHTLLSAKSDQSAGDAYSRGSGSGYARCCRGLSLLHMVAVSSRGRAAVDQLLSTVCAGSSPAGRPNLNGRCGVVGTRSGVKSLEVGSGSPQSGSNPDTVHHIFAIGSVAELGNAAWKHVILGLVRASNAGSNPAGPNCFQYSTQPISSRFACDDSAEADKSVASVPTRTVNPVGSLCSAIEKYLFEHSWHPKQIQRSLLAAFSSLVRTIVERIGCQWFSCEAPL